MSLESSSSSSSSSAVIIAESIVTWLQGSFESDLARGCASSSDLFDGRVLRDAFSEISPEHAPPQDDDDEGGGSSSWLSAAQTLKALKTSLETFFSESTSLHVDLSEVNVTAIARDEDVGQLVVLAEAVLGAAMQCERNSEFVSKIMSLDQAHQATLMVSVESFMQRAKDADASPAPPNNRRRISMESVDSENSVSSPTSSKEKSAASSEKQEQLESTIRVLNSKLEKANGKLDGAMEQVSDLESQMADLHASLDKKEKQFEEAMVENEGERARMEEEIRLQADELDISRSKLIELSRIEGRYSKLKQRLEESSNAEDRLKETRAENDDMLQKIAAMEVELKMLPSLKAQLESCKTKLFDAEMRLTETAGDLEAKTKECARHKEASSALEKTVRELQATVQTAKQEMASLEAEIEEQDADLVRKGDGGSNVDLKNRVALLEKENAALKAGASDDTDLVSRLAVAESEVEDLTRLKKSLQTTAVKNRARIAELETAASAVAETTAAAASATAAVSESNEDHESLVRDLRSQLRKVRAEMKQKSEDCAQHEKDKEKLESYVRQALSQTQMKYKVAISQMEEKLKEKETAINALRQMRDEDKMQHRREEKLIMSAFYEIGLDIQRRAVSGQSKGFGAEPHQQAASWLGRQRQKRNKR